MMNLENFTHLLELWLVLLVFQALFINGIKLGAEGKTTQLPNGETRDGEMLLYPVFKELTKQVQAKLYYTGEHFKSALDKLTWPSYSGAAQDHHLDFDTSVIQIFTQDYLDGFKNAIKASAYKAEFLPYGDLIFSPGVPCQAKLYTDDYRYVYPVWIRKPIIQCIVCMASFWSIFTFMIPMFAIAGFQWWIPVLWFVNIPLLATVNKIIYNYV